MPGGENFVEAAKTTGEITRNIEEKHPVLLGLLFVDLEECQRGNTVKCGVG